MKKNKLDKKFKVLLIGITIINFVIVFCFGLAYGNWFGFQDYFITTALTTGNHQYLAYVLYDSDTIREVSDRNTVISNDSSNSDDIDINATKKKSTYKNSYEEQVLDRDDDALYKVVQLTMDADGVEGYVAFIYDPTRISLALSDRFPQGGEQLYKFYETHDALLAINAGGHGYGADNIIIPAGNLIVDGEIIQESDDEPINGGGLIGFNSQGVLMLSKSSAQAALNEGMVCGVEFGPFLIVNGEAVEINGNGGYGVHPRTAIGQRKDGIVIFLVIEGRNAESSGADMNTLIEIFERYEAYNAANLDGGGSSTIMEKGVVLNRSLGDDYTVSTRFVSNAFIVK